METQRQRRLAGKAVHKVPELFCSRTRSGYRSSFITRWIQKVLSCRYFPWLQVGSTGIIGAQHSPGSESEHDFFLSNSTVGRLFLAGFLAFVRHQKTATPVEA